NRIGEAGGGGKRVGGIGVVENEDGDRTGAHVFNQTKNAVRAALRLAGGADGDVDRVLEVAERGVEEIAEQVKAVGVGGLRGSTLRIDNAATGVFRERACHADDVRLGDSGLLRDAGGLVLLEER